MRSFALGRIDVRWYPESVGSGRHHQLAADRYTFVLIKRAAELTQLAQQAHAAGRSAQALEYLAEAELLAADVEQLVGELEADQVKALLVEIEDHLAGVGFDEVNQASRFGAIGRLFHKLKVGLGASIAAGAFVVEF